MFKNPFFLSLSQNPPDPPQIYLTSVGDPSSLIPIGPVRGKISPVPPLHISMGPQLPQQDNCGGIANPESFPTQPHTVPHTNHPSPLFVIINPSPLQQQSAVTAAVAPPPLIPSPTHSPPPPPIIIKEENLPSEEELLEIVSLEEKQVEEVRQERLNHLYTWGTCFCYFRFSLRL